MAHTICNSFVMKITVHGGRRMKRNYYKHVGHLAHVCNALEGKRQDETAGSRGKECRIHYCDKTNGRKDNCTVHFCNPVNLSTFDAHQASVLVFNLLVF